MTTRLSGVYGIVHVPSGNVYVGSSQDIIQRWRRHASSLGAGRHHCQDFLRLWLLDGPTAFTFMVLEQCPPDDLIIREQAWLDRFAEVLNVGLVVDAPMRGRHHTDEGRSRISGTMRRLGIKPICAGEPHTEATRLKMSATRMGHPTSSETRAKISVANRAAWARQPDRQRSEASREKTGESVRRAYAEGRCSRIRTSAHRAKISATLTGKVHHNPETRAKISTGTRVALARPEVKAKLSDARRASWITRKNEDT